MTRIFRLDQAERRDHQVEAQLREWKEERGRLGGMACRCFEDLRGLGDDIREVLHDGQPTACVGDLAFAYVDVFSTHANLGFFDGAALPDPTGLLEGNGRFMRHVKLRPETPPEEDDVRRLIEEAYAGMKSVARKGRGG